MYIREITCVCVFVCVHICVLEIVWKLFCQNFRSHFIVNWFRVSEDCYVRTDTMLPSLSNDVSVL